MVQFSEKLPPVEHWGKRIYQTEDFAYPDTLNAAYELLDRNIERGYGYRPAIFYKDRVLSYHELHAVVQRMSNGLQKLGVKRGDRVMLRFPNTPTAVALWLAVLRVGGVVVMVMPMLRAREISYRANDAECSHIFCDINSIDEVKKAEPQLQNPATILVCDGNDDRYASFEDVWVHESSTHAAELLSRSDLALIGYTSGSTGDAKGTVHFHDDVLAIADGYAKHILNPIPEDIFAGHPSLAFTFGLGGLLVFPFRFGASVVLLDQFTPENMLRTLSEYRATISFCAPTCYNMMMRLDVDGKYDLSHLRIGVSAGETLPQPVYEKWKAKYGIDLLDGIGSTEMLHIFVSNGQARAWIHGKNYRRRRKRTCTQHARLTRDHGSNRMPLLE
jgi:2-aminobenzoate-CoA ligase